MKNVKEIFIGIDPSLNSTGICILIFENNIKIKENFYIVKPDKLTKKEIKCQEELLNFDYVLYEKEDLSKYNENNHWHEYYKSINMVKLVDKIYEVVNDISIKGLNSENKINIVMEGISYGSTIRTKSVFDLAGLNFMVRQRILKNDNLFFTIATPSEMKKYISGNGNCKKDIIIELFKASHPEMNLPKIDDIADAYYMAKYARKIYLDNNE